MEMQASNENQSYNRVHGISPPHKAPAVRLNIKIEDKAPSAKEVVRKVTKGHEVVEVDGFVFKRKRPQPEKDAAPAASEQSAAKKVRLQDTSPQPAATPQHHITAATPAALTNKSPQQVLPQHLTATTPGIRARATPATRAAATPVDATPVTRALLQQLPTDAAEPDRLASLCELLCAAEIEEWESDHAAEDTAAVDAVKAVLAAFATSVRKAAAEGSFQAAAAAEPSGAAEQHVAEEYEWDVQLDLEARKAGLRSQLAKFTREEEEWQEVIAQQDNWQQQQQQAAAQDMTTKEEADVTPQAAAVAHADEVDAAAPVLDTDAPDSRAATPPGVEDTGPLPQHGSARPGAREQDAQVMPSQAGLLRKAEADAHRKVAIQVESLCAMVSGIEELVLRAENHCTAMQAHYHKQRFCSFPHVESPARLIQELSQAKTTLAELPF